MKRLLVFVITILLLPLGAFAPHAAANSTSLVDAGYTQESDNSFVYWVEMFDGSILTVDDTGNLSVNSFVSGILLPQWSLNLNVSANAARLDAAQQLTVVCHDSGVSTVHMDLQIENWNMSTPESVNDADWDNEGDLWLAFFAGRRRAEEYNSEGATGSVTSNIQSGFNAFDVLSDGRIVIGSYDKKVYVFSNQGTSLTTLTESTAIVNSLIEDHNGDLLVGTANGKLHRYNTSSWAHETLSLSHGYSIVSLEEFDNMTYHIGTQNGELTLVSVSSFTEQISYSSTGRVIGSFAAYTGEVYIVTSSSSSSKIRLYDLDSDGDGYTDQLDAFPSESSQWMDSDGDGYGDNSNGYLPDSFPNEVTQWSDSDGDGYGDNAGGFEGDVFPNNADQWVDSDNDGYGDNVNGENGDAFIDEPSQWSDADQDGYGDNPNGITPDACPNFNGFSNQDRFGCLDSDLDGWSNPTENWTVALGADALPSIASQWRDGDGDGYGDNISGDFADDCNWKAGNSTKAWIVNQSAAIGYIEVDSFGCEDLDGDGWVDVTESQGMELDPNEHFDADKDGVGSNADYDDSRPLVQTEEDHCLLNFDDESSNCQGWRNKDYQSYLSREKVEGEYDLSFSAWNASKNAGLLESDSVDSNIVKQVVTVGGGAFLGLTAVILVISFIMKRRKTNSLVKMYGVPYVPTENKSAENEALEGTAGLSAQGGIVADSAWEDDVAQLDFTVPDDEFENTEDGSSTIDSSSLYGDDDSLEAIAGISKDSMSPEPEPETVNSEPEEQESQVPPVPASGLPEGWTMDQWKWYGQEWLDKQK